MGVTKVVTDTPSLGSTRTVCSPTVRGARLRRTARRARAAEPQSSRRHCPVLVAARPTSPPTKHHQPTNPPHHKETHHVHTTTPVDRALMTMPAAHSAPPRRAPTGARRAIPPAGGRRRRNDADPQPARPDPPLDGAAARAVARIRAEHARSTACSSRCARPGVRTRSPPPPASRHSRPSSASTNDRLERLVRYGLDAGLARDRPARPRRAEQGDDVPPHRPSLGLASRGWTSVRSRASSMRRRARPVGWLAVRSNATTAVLRLDGSPPTGVEPPSTGRWQPADGCMRSRSIRPSSGRARPRCAMSGAAPGTSSQRCSTAIRVGAVPCSTSEVVVGRGVEHERLNASPVMPSSRYRPASTRTCWSTSCTTGVTPTRCGS